MLKFEMVLRCDEWLIASREAPLRRRVSECIVASRVWGLGVAVKIRGSFKVRRVAGCVEGKLFWGVASRSAALLLGLGGFGVSVET